MLIQHLRVSNVRNITHASLELDPKLNFVIGRNGAGKSSLLEALSLLSSGKSFRTRKVQSVITENQNQLILFAKCLDSDKPTTVGILRDAKGEFRAKINGQPCHRLSEVSHLLPVFVVAPGFYDEISNQRAARLRLLDWGLFHVEHQFYPCWKEFHQLLKQRNALLKQIKIRKQSSSQLDYWDNLLSERAEQVSQLRAEYVKQLDKAFTSSKEHFEDFHQDIQLIYFSGVSKKFKSLKEALAEQREVDVQRGVTQSGPHRADLKLIKSGQPVMEVASRGQQKVVVNRIMITLIEHFIKVSGKSCLIAIDDLASELDKINQNQLLQSLMGLEGAQIIVTGITQDSLPEAISGYNGRMFHVEHGSFQVQ